MVLGQSAGLSKEACLYAGADWLSSSVSQKVHGERSVLSLGTTRRKERAVGGSIFECMQRLPRRTISVTKLAAVDDLPSERCFSHFR